MRMRNLFLTGIFLIVSGVCFSQNVGINTTGATPDPTAMLDIVASDKGVLIPRVALTGTTDVTTIPGATVSLLVYNTATAGSGTTAVTPGYYYWDGSVWLTLTTGGQSSTSYFTTGSITVTSVTGLTYVPGYPTAAITIPANATVLLSADIGVATNSGTTGGFSSVDVLLVVDGFVAADGLYQRTMTMNNGGVGGTMQYASMSQAITLTPGTHTFGIAVAGTGIGSNATVGGNSTSVLQGELTVTIIKK